MKRFLTSPAGIVVALTGLCLSVVLLWSPAQSVIAFPRGGHSMMGFDGGRGNYTMGGPMGVPLQGMIHMMDELDLSAEQRDSVGEIMDDRMPKARKLAFAMFDHRKALKELAKKEPFDAKAVRKTADAMGDTVADLTVLMTSSMADLRAVLTPEQRERFEKMGKHRGHRGRHHKRDGHERSSPE